MSTQSYPLLPSKKSERRHNTLYKLYETRENYVFMWKNGCNPLGTKGKGFFCCRHGHSLRNKMPTISAFKCLQCPFHPFLECKHGQHFQACDQCSQYDYLPVNKEQIIPNMYYFYKGLVRYRDDKNRLLCEHKKRYEQCLQCHGRLICPHDRRRDICMDCNGKKLRCEHGKIKRKCKLCYKSLSCARHGRLKNCCKECHPDMYITQLLRSRLHEAIAKNGTKTQRTLEYLGCNVQQFRQFLERRFLPGMTWQNQGEWHIDHRRPCASFDLCRELHMRQCFHYTNMQPLWAGDNMTKSAKFDSSTFTYAWIGDCWITFTVN